MTTPSEVPGSGLARKCQALICPEAPGSDLALHHITAPLASTKGPSVFPFGALPA